jgi:hypothetical protein
MQVVFLQCGGRESKLSWAAALEAVYNARVIPKCNSNEDILKW